MDYPLGGILGNPFDQNGGCLNPYSNGLPSRGRAASDQQLGFPGLNPYSNGLPSRGQVHCIRKTPDGGSLNPYSNGLPSRGG